MDPDSTQVPSEPGPAPRQTRAPDGADVLEVVRDEVIAMRKELREVAEAQGFLRMEFREVLVSLDGVVKGECTAGTADADGLGAMVASRKAALCRLVPCTQKPVEPADYAAPKFGSDLSVDASKDPDELNLRMSTKTMACHQSQMKDELLETIKCVEREEEKQQELAVMRSLRRWSVISREALRKCNSDDLVNLVDSLMGVVICANAIFIGFSMDMHDKTLKWYAADIFFSSLFLGELTVKVYLKGFRAQYCVGLRSQLAVMDAGIVFVDLAQLILALAGVDGTGDLPSASLFRLLRLLKLARVLSALRTDIFKDLLAMIQGMMGGMMTLCWSMVLFLLTVYMVGLIYREILGRQDTKIVSGFFDSVPRALFTTFRCSFGDCSTEAGTPILEHILQERGVLPSFVWCSLTFMVTIGLCNVISAIFVQATMSAAMALSETKRRARLVDDRLWNTRICILIRQLLEASPEHTPPEKLSDAIDDIAALEVPLSVIDALVHDPVAVAALRDLEIEDGDHCHLSDILDPDMSGMIGMNEFVEGLRRLRGTPRRSDIVTVDLMVRAMQRNIADLMNGISELVTGTPASADSVAN